MIKKFNSYKLFESYSKPEPKYPINYKCLDVTSAYGYIEKKLKIDIGEIKVKGSKYGTESFFNWCGENIDPIYPKHTMAEAKYNYDKKQYAGMPIPATKWKYFEREAVYQIPMEYDATGDEIIWQIKRDRFRENMTKMLAAAGKKYNTDDEKHINFGSKSNDWINIPLKAFYDLFSEYYVNGKLLIWNDEDEYPIGKEIFDYPMEKAIFLSELEEWISDFNMDTSKLYEWILDTNYVEGRYWENTWTYELSDTNFKGDKVPKSIKPINELLKQTYKTNELDIYLDYYKPVVFKD